MTTTRKNYTALAAEMMGWVLYDTEVWRPAKPEQFEYALNNDGYHWEGSGLNYAHNWNPLEDRNQAYMVLKRAEELGLADEVEASIYLTLKYLNGFAWGDLSVGEINWKILTCPTDIITKACVDVWQAWKAEERANHGN